jgi:hypothetical protein
MQVVTLLGGEAPPAPAQLHGLYQFGADAVDLACIRFPVGFVTNATVKVVLNIGGHECEGKWDVDARSISFFRDSFVVKPFYSIRIYLDLTTLRRVHYNISCNMAPPATVLRNVAGNPVMLQVNSFVASRGKPVTDVTPVRIAFEVPFAVPALASATTPALAPALAPITLLSDLPTPLQGQVPCTAESIDLACIQFPVGAIQPGVVGVQLAINGVDLVGGSWDMNKQTVSFFLDSFVVRPFLNVYVMFTYAAGNHVGFVISTPLAPPSTVLRDLSGRTVLVRFDTSSTVEKPCVFDVVPVLLHSELEREHDGA